VNKDTDISSDPPVACSTAVVPDARVRAIEPRRESLEAALELKQREVERLTAELNTFAHSVSHDLRAPLRTILGFGEILKADFGAILPSEADSHLERMIRAARRMDRLILDVLEYSRAARAEVQLEPIDLGQAAQEALRSVDSLYAQRAAFTIAGPPGEGIGSRNLLQKVLQHLFENAVKFRREDVPLAVVVRSERRGARVRLWIEDNGVGVAPEFQEKIWHIFERLMPERDGNGVGLAVVRRAMARMQGDCGVESMPPGSRFWIELPTLD
jgi:signal transduction histidine kinase